MLNAMLFWQLATTIAILILIFEGVFLYFSVDAKRAELLDIRQDLDRDVFAAYDSRFNELRLDILSDPDIERRPGSIGSTFFRW